MNNKLKIRQGHIRQVWLQVNNQTGGVKRYRLKIIDFWILYLFLFKATVHLLISMKIYTGNTNCTWKKLHHNCKKKIYTYEWNKTQSKEFKKKEHF